MGSKFHGLKNKGKKRNSPVKPVEVDEALVAQQQAMPAITEDEIKTLMDGLNEVAEAEKMEHEVEFVKELELVPSMNDLAEVKLNIDGVVFEAYGICYSEENKKYMKISIDYNPKTGYTKIKSVEPWADAAPTALNKLNRIMSLKLMRKEERY